MTLVFGAIAYAGSGGAQNLCQSNWIRDKGFGMGCYIPRLVSPITGAAEATGATATSYIFEPTAENLRRWRSWWQFANLEQALSFGLVTVVTIALMSLMAYTTVFGQPHLPNDVSFLRLEAERLRGTVGPWFGVLFLGVGAFSLFGTAMGIIDYTSRLAADVLKTAYLPDASESRIYFRLVWGMVALGCVILLAGMSQPMTLLVISASTAGTHDVHLFLPAHRAQPPDAAGGDPHQRVPDGRPGLVDAAVRSARRRHDSYSDAGAAPLTLNPWPSPREFHPPGVSRMARFRPRLPAILVGVSAVGSGRGPQQRVSVRPGGPGSAVDRLLRVG